MRSSFIMSGLVFLALLTGGCAHFSGVTYLKESVVSDSKGIRIQTDDDDKRRLAIALALPTTNSVPITVSPSESWLADAQGHHYHLAFESIPVGSRDMTAGRLWCWYYITTCGSNSSESRMVFRKGSYSICVVFSAGGERQVAERQFMLVRYSIPYPILLIGWLFLPEGRY
jgi:hypothetical protein